MSAREPATDDGQISLLILGMSTLCIALVLVFVAASSVHLQHRRLVDTADAVAVDAADAVDLDRYFAQGAADHVPITDATVRASAVRLLGRAGAVPGCTDLRVSEPTGVSADGEVILTLSCRARPAFAGMLDSVPLRVPLEVTTGARTRSDG